MVLVEMKRSNDQDSPRLRRTCSRFSEIPRGGPQTSSSKKNQVEENTFCFKPLVFHELLNNQPNRPQYKSPEPRSGHRIVCDDANLYSFGGYLEVGSGLNHPHPMMYERQMQRLFEELWCFNFAEGEWKYLPTSGRAPKELASHSAILYGNYLIVFGGTGVPFGGSSSNKMKICDLRRLAWKTIETTGEPPTPQYGQAVVMDSTKRAFYVIGGTTGYDYSMDIHKLDLTTKHWEKVFVSRGDSSEPQPRYRHEIAFDGDNIYILGGGTAREAYELKFVPTFNLAAKEWAMLKTKGSPTASGTRTVLRFPCPRKCQGSVQMGNDVYICGGYDSKNIFVDLWKLHIPTMQWQFLPVKMPIPLYFHSTSITSGGCMYIFGGVTHIKNNTRTNRIFKIWLTVPKLKEISWEAVLHYKKDMKGKTRNELLHSGIPVEFVNRLHPAPPGGLSDLTPQVRAKWQKNIELIDITDDDV